MFTPSLNRNFVQRNAVCSRHRKPLKQGISHRSKVSLTSRHRCAFAALSSRSRCVYVSRKHPTLAVLGRFFPLATAFEVHSRSRFCRWLPSTHPTLHTSPSLNPAFLPICPGRANLFPAVYSCQLCPPWHKRCLCAWRCLIRGCCSASGCITIRLLWEVAATAHCDNGSSGGRPNSHHVVRPCSPVTWVKTDKTQSTRREVTKGQCLRVSAKEAAFTAQGKGAQGKGARLCGQKGITAARLPRALTNNAT